MPGIIHGIRNALGCFLGPFQRDNQSRPPRSALDIQVIFEDSNRPPEHSANHSRKKKPNRHYDRVSFQEPVIDPRYIPKIFKDRVIFNRGFENQKPRTAARLNQLFTGAVYESPMGRPHDREPTPPPRELQHAYDRGAAPVELDPYAGPYALGRADGEQVHNPIYQDNHLGPQYVQMGAADLYNNVNMEPPENDPDYALAEQGPQPPRPGIYFLGGALDAAAGYQEMDVHEEPPVMGLYDPGRSQDEINDERYYHEAENPQN